MTRTTAAVASGAAAGARQRTVLPGLQTLPEQIAERIYAAIVAGDYQPGERIREEELAESFGVSRGPVREALRILERDSVVRVVPNRGAHVTPLSAKELSEIFEIRRVLAGAMVRRLGEAHPALLARFGEQVAQLEQLAAGPDPAAYVATSVELSLTLAQASGNERLAQIMRSLARSPELAVHAAGAQCSPAARRVGAQLARLVFGTVPRRQRGGRQGDGKAGRGRAAQRAACAGSGRGRPARRGEAGAAGRRPGTRSSRQAQVRRLAGAACLSTESPCVRTLIAFECKFPSALTERSISPRPCNAA